VHVANLSVLTGISIEIWGETQEIEE